MFAASASAFGKASV